MNVNINNKNLFSQSLLINKFFFQKNSSHKQTGITTVDSGCQYRNNNYYYNKDGVPFLSKEQADRCINGNKEEQKEIFIEKNFFMGSRNNCSANNGIGDICDHVK